MVRAVDKADAMLTLFSALYRKPFTIFLQHFLLYAVYICQKSLNFIYAFKCYQQITINLSWLHFSWPTLYRHTFVSLYRCCHNVLISLCAGHSNYRPTGNRQAQHVPCDISYN